MEIKYQSILGGRVALHALGGTYRDHHLTEILSLRCGLDTPSAVASGYSTTGTSLFFPLSFYPYETH